MTLDAACGAAVAPLASTRAPPAAIAVPASAAATRRPVGQFPPRRTGVRVSFMSCSYLFGLRPSHPPRTAGPSAAGHRGKPHRGGRSGRGLPRRDVGDAPPRKELEIRDRWSRGSEKLMADGDIRVRLGQLNDGGAD